MLLAFSIAGAAEEAQTKDLDRDGKIDTWIIYDDEGFPLKASFDRHVDGKPDAWKYYRKGLVYKREWDRNFDGKPDLRIFESFGRFTEKVYDDNFDGKFDRKVQAPKRGEAGRIQTTPPGSENQTQEA